MFNTYITIAVISPEMFQYLILDLLLVWQTLLSIFRTFVPAVLKLVSNKI
jgi:hypothetical protein